MNASERLAAINADLAKGATVYVSTYTRCTKVTPATAARWAKAGHELFKVKGNSLYMAVGRRFDCIDYCNITSRV